MAMPTDVPIIDCMIGFPASDFSQYEFIRKQLRDPEFTARMGVVDHKWLAKNRKFALLLAFVFGAILTPPDLFSQTSIALPFQRGDLSQEYPSSMLSCLYGVLGPPRPS